MPAEGEALVICVDRGERGPRLGGMDDGVCGDMSIDESCIVCARNDGKVQVGSRADIASVTCDFVQRYECTYVIARGACPNTTCEPEDGRLRNLSAPDQIGINVSCRFTCSAGGNF